MIAGFTRRPCGGFTLIEMLVAVLVGLLVLVAVHGVFLASLTAERTTSSQTEVDRRAQVAMDEITSWLRHASPSILLNTRPILDDYDTLHRDRIHFAAAPGADLEPIEDQAGLDQDVRYWVNNGSLMRKVGGTDDYTGGVVLAKGVTELRFTFYDVGGNAVTQAAQTVSVGVTLRIQDGTNWSLLQSAVRLRNA